MKNFVLCTLRNGEYDGLLVCLSFESIVNYIDLIEKDSNVLNKNGRLLIDQILVSGNGRNRFISCNYKNGKLDLSSCINVSPSMRYRKLSSRLLKANNEFIANSILTDEQRDCIKSGNWF